jgi:para-nitrobenzyl esterase
MTDLVVTTPLGNLQGIEQVNGSVRAFLGIPTGTADRWKKPVPIEPWTGVRDATKFGSPPAKLPDRISFIPAFKESKVRVGWFKRTRE